MNSVPSRDIRSRPATWVLVAVLGLALALRLSAAAGRYLNADEIIYYQTAVRPAVASVTRLSTITAHPPLFFAILHFWVRAGRSEVFLRLLSVMAGSATVGILYLWTRNLFGEAAALAAGAIAAVTPILVDLSSQIRGYALLHLFIATAFFLLDRYFRTRSRLDLVGSSASMLAALLTEYCAVFAAASLGALALLHIVRGRTPRRDLLLWGALQILLLTVVGATGTVAIATLRGGPLEQQAQTGMLRFSYHDPSREPAAAFLISGTASIGVEYLGLRFAQAPPYGSRHVDRSSSRARLPARQPRSRGTVPAQAAAMLAAGGFCLYLVRRRLSTPGCLDLAVAAGVAFGLTGAAGVARLYPYGATRHDSFLILFLLPLLGLVLSELAQNRRAILFALVVGASAYHLSGSELRDLVSPARDDRIVTMRAAASALRGELSGGGTIFTDRVGARLLSYYLADRDTSVGFTRPWGADRGASSRRVHVVRGDVYTFDGDAAIFSNSLSRAAAMHEISSPCWVFIGGSPHLSTQLPATAGVHRFGPQIEFFQYVFPSA